LYGNADDFKNSSFDKLLKILKPELIGRLVAILANINS